MEQSSYSNVVVSNASDPFLNGGQQTGSDSSSSDTSASETPSHSYKSSLSPSSSSSDELLATNDMHSRQQDQLPYATTVPFSKQVISNNCVAISDQSKGNNMNVVPVTYTNNAHAHGDASKPSSFNQDLFQSGSGNVTHNFNNISDFNRAAGNVPVKATDEVERSTKHTYISRAPPTFQQYHQSGLQLPNTAQTPTVSSFFSNTESPTVPEFPSPGRVPPSVENQFPSNFHPTQRTTYSALMQPSTTQTSYTPNALAKSNTFSSAQSQDVSNESPKYTKAELSNSFSVNCSTSAFSQYSSSNSSVVSSSQTVSEATSVQQSFLPKNLSLTPQLQQPSLYPVQLQRSLGERSLQKQVTPIPILQPPQQQTIPEHSLQKHQPSLMPPSQSNKLQSMQMRERTAPRNQIFPPEYVQPSTENQFPTVNQPPSSYQNVSLHQNVSQSLPTPQPAYTNLSQQQVDNNQSSQSSIKANRGPPPQIGAQGFEGFPQGQHYLSTPFQQPVTNQPRTSNRLYMNNGPQQTPSQGTQYSAVPKQMSGRYPSHTNDMQPIDTMSAQFGNLNVTKQGFYATRGMESCDLLRMRDILPAEKIQAPSIQLAGEIPNENNCHPDIFRCTLTKVPQSKSLLDKSRLPLGILLHPFRDLTHLSVIQCSTIVRCRACRTYINPFVYFTDNRHWKCNLCFRANDFPDDFRYNPLTKMHDDPMRRPEVTSATVEFIASSEYMVRPPQPAIYLFVFDVSRIATQTGYLATVCEILSANLTQLPGDARTSVGFITVDSAIRFYELSENLNQPHELIVTDVEDIFIPHPDNLIVNLSEQLELIKQLLEQIPEKFKESYDTNCALGAALQAAYKLMAPTGGRVTVFVSCLPNYGPGALKPREEPNQRGNNKSVILNPATDFYKKLALDCNGQHVAVDLFIVNAQFVDLATISGISQVSGGCMHYFPLYNNKNGTDVEKLVKTLERYLTRKIGFEAVMRMRCTRGLSIHSFHGNFFVRTTDLLALPNINPDAGFGMQVSIDENLSHLQNICFQAALLYTSSKGERRIRVHTLCLPITNNLHDVLVSADQQCIAGLLAKMAVDRSLQSSVTDAREAFVNAVCDILNAYKMVSPSSQPGTLLAPNNLSVFPLYILGLLKSVSFRLTPNTRTDDRVYSMYQMKCTPLDKLIQIIYPDLYPIHNLNEIQPHEIDGRSIVIPPLLQLSAERIVSSGVYLLDEGDSIIIFVCHNIPSSLCQNLFGCPQFSSIPEIMNNLPLIETQENKLAHSFISFLQSKKSYPVIIQVLKDTTQMRTKFFERLVEDKTELGISYYEFLQTVSSQMNY